jgi:hypothetical protein
MGNFVGSVTSLAAAGGMAVVESEAALTGWIGAMLADPARRAAMGEAARKVAAVELDLPARMAARLVALMG